MSLVNDVIDQLMKILDRTFSLKTKRRFCITCKSLKGKYGYFKVLHDPWLAIFKTDIESLKHSAVIFGADEGFYALKKMFQRFIFVDGSMMAKVIAKHAPKTVILWIVRNNLVSQKRIDYHLGKSEKYLSKTYVEKYTKYLKKQTQLDKDEIFREIYGYIDPKWSNPYKYREIKPHKKDFVYAFYKNFCPNKTSYIGYSVVYARSQEDYDREVIKLEKYQGFDIARNASMCLYVTDKLNAMIGYPQSEVKVHRKFF